MRTALPPAPKKARRSEVSRQLDESVFCEDGDDDDSPYTMYFVKIPTIEDDSPTEEEATVHADLFKTLTDSGIGPQWIDADEVFVQAQKDDFYVVPAFRGTIFRKLANEGYRVYGPPIVAECLDEPKPLPLWTHPVYSSVFEGAQISFTGLSSEKKHEIQEKVGWMNGIISGTLFESITHLIADKADSCSEKYKTARRSNLKLMRKEWVEEIWEKTQLKMGKFSAINDDVINSYKMRIFEGLEFTLTKIEGTDRTNTVKLIEENGGKMSGNMSRKTCTHLVTDQMSGAKYKKAVEWGTIRIVQKRWLRKCVESGGVVDEAKYHPKYLTATAVEHFLSSTPQKESPIVSLQSFADVSSISGAGGRLNCSMNSSNVSSLNRVTPRVFERPNSTTHVSASNIESPAAVQKRVVRQSTTFCDPIDTLLLESDEDSDIFEGCLLWLCGIDEKKLDKWRRLIDRSGGTRPNKINFATHVIVHSPNETEKTLLRSFSSNPGMSMVNVNWIVECFKKKKVVPPEGFEWNSNNMEETLINKSFERSTANIATKTADSSLTTCIDEPATKIIGVFSACRFFVHETSPKNIIEKYSEVIRKNGGILTERAEDAEYVVFDHSAPINTLLSFNAVITYLYIDTCVKKSKFLDVATHPLFVPLPRPIMPIFRGVNVILYLKDEFIYNYLKDLMEVSGGTVHPNSNKAQETSYIVMMEVYDVAKIDKNQRMKMCDLSWIISSIANCRRLSFGDHLFNGIPLEGFERNDDVWVKCTNDKDNATIVMAVDENDYEPENEREMEEEIILERNCGKEEKPKEYKTDLTKPYKIRLKNLDEIHEKIDAIPSPSRVDSEESMTTSRIGSILKKAVENTGRRNATKTDEGYVKFEMHRRFVFSCSDMKPETRAEMKSIVVSLNGSVDENFTFQTTHLICAKMNRTPKAVCTIAAGKWCLQPQYIYDSKRAGKWLDERKYEWTPEKLTSKKNDLEMRMVNRCRYWREKIEQMPITMSVRMESRSNGAFSDWKCVIHSEDARSLLILPILEAGGAQVFTVIQYTEVVPLNPTHVFVSKDFDWNVQSIAMLRRESINLLILDYIFEFLMDENVNVAKFLKSSA